MRVTAFIFSMALMVSVVFADDHHVDFDRHTDFSKLKTFALREGKVDSPRPELNNTILLTKIADAIRKELTANGLKETLSNPDVLVDYNVTAEDFNEQRGGRVTSTEGTLVVDMIKRESRALVWRGVYRDSEKNSAKLAQNLPGDVKKFLSEFPPKQKGPIEPGPSTLVTEKPSAKAAAVAAIEVVAAITQDKDFVGTGHPGLAISLAKLDRAARALAEDNGRSPAATSNRTTAFYSELNDAADYAASIASRNVETANSREKARSLAAKLRALDRD
jgi:hypothetical protein